LKNRRLRERAYAKQQYQRTTAASRTMMITGIVLLGFLVFHLLHFTVGAILPEAYRQTDSEGRHDVYAMVVDGFREPAIVAVYLLGLAAVATHLVHAISSVWQTLGLARQGDESTIRRASPIIAAVIILGFAAVPLSIAFGLVGG